MITVQLHNLIFACKYNRRALRKVTSSFEEVLYGHMFFSLIDSQNSPKMTLHENYNHEFYILKI